LRDAAFVQGTNELEVAFSSEAAFRVWYDHALPRVYGFVLGHVGGDRELAEEITQQAFAGAVRDFRRFDGRSDSVTWLCSIARHKLADHWRRLERDERRHLQFIGAGGPDRDDAAWRSADERDRLMGALAAMPAMQRAALLLFYADDLPVREIARTLRKSEKAVESLLSRGRDAFRAAYREGGDV
jgi:RNA polymerase sigma-70 factor (ECF subfamily)